MAVAGAAGLVRVQVPAAAVLAVHLRRRDVPAVHGVLPAVQALRDV
jgi:hypothetical protein